jgi:nucleoside phosphorylase
VTRILVLTAVELEATRLARDLALAPVAGSGWPHFRSGALEIACVGLGASRLDERAARCATPALVVSAGACGALAPDLGEGQLVVPEAVLLETGARYPTAPLAGQTRRGTLLTVARVVESPSAKARLWVETGALAVDMESGVILEWAARRALPAAVVRGVSDTASRAVPADLAAVVEPDGRVRTMRAIGVALARPRRIGEALALRRGTSAALTAVAAALGKLAHS